MTPTYPATLCIIYLPTFEIRLGGFHAPLSGPGIRIAIAHEIKIG